MPEGQLSGLSCFTQRQKRLEQIASVWNSEKKEVALAWARQLRDICSISPHLKTSEKKIIYKLNLHCRIVDISDWIYMLYLY